MEMPAVTSTAIGAKSGAAIGENDELNKRLAALRQN
jgi:hypothetical protein